MVPLARIRRIDYRVSGAGDPKDVWELNRHTFLPHLGRAFFLSGDGRYAQRAVSLILSWIEQCPPGHTIHWTSGIEIAIRMISWIWTLRFLHGSKALSPRPVRQIRESLFNQARHVRRHLSLHSSANNHLITELAGLAVAADALAQPRWSALAASLLEQQAVRQIREDGVGAEQSPGYQANTMESFLLAFGPLERRGYPASQRTLHRLSRGADFLSSVIDRNGRPYPLGDWDDTEILQLSGDFGYIPSLVDTVGWLAGRTRQRRVGAGQDEKAFWMLGPEAFSHLTACPDSRSEARRAFPHGGYYVLRRQVRDSNVRVLFDCGPLGMRPLNGHGHSDALSFVLYVNGRAVFIDPGTYTYYSSPKWRDYFRSTAAHNTVRVDGRDQATFSGPFCGTDRARSQCLGFEDGVSVAGRHFSYCGGPDPVTHSRTLQFVDAPDSGSVCLRITDRLAAAAPHAYELFFHLDGKWTVEQCAASGYRLIVPEGVMLLRLDDRLNCSAERGGDGSTRGWMSRSFASIEPATTIVGSMRAASGVELVTTIEFRLELQTDGAGYSGSVTGATR